MEEPIKDTDIEITFPGKQIHIPKDKSVMLNGIVKESHNTDIGTTFIISLSSLIDIVDITKK